MDGKSDASPFHGAEQDTSADEASGGILHKNRKHLHHVQKAKRNKKKKHWKREEKWVGRFIRDLKRENEEMEKEIGNLQSKEAELNKQKAEFSNAKNEIVNQEILVETFLQKPLVQQLLGANNVEAPLLGNRLDGTLVLKDRVIILDKKIDSLCRLFVE